MTSINSQKIPLIDFLIYTTYIAMTSRTKRNVYTSTVLFCVFFLPWYTYLFLIVVGMFVFNKYYEGVVCALVVDFLFGYKSGGMIGLSYSTTLITSCVLLLSLLVRDKLSVVYDHA